MDRQRSEGDGSDYCTFDKLEDGIPNRQSHDEGRRGMLEEMHETGGSGSSLLACSAVVGIDVGSRGEKPDEHRVGGLEKSGK
ncbi:hypothetical protein NDU88_003303 [Pleurodeles waltl]|uniref:Uncharacterized protein n=1 Tax=Pleurodeles waltl TaxID=8319 RepID=A0AAV7RFV7_PLEWA|nr:hypothetical protein NDU88_003303 [Pleurodeles waltl]